MKSLPLLPLFLLALGFAGSGCHPYSECDELGVTVDDDTTLPDDDTTPSPSDLDGDGFAVEDGDCDDTDSGIYPGAPELCDEEDNDCDTEIDEDPANGFSFYEDSDGDKYGDAGSMMFACDTPPGYVNDDTDCNDEDEDIHPGAEEHCDGVDEDCDSLIDEDVADAPTWYQDVDGDEYGNPEVSVVSCTPPLGYVEAPGDCDDSDPLQNPDAAELCNGEDDDCNGLIDDEPIDETAWYNDNDGDGYGDGAAVFACVAPPGTVDNNGDCDDGDAEYHPGAPETCADASDFNCDGESGFADADGDGYAACEDCNDLDPSVYPAAPEACDGVDDDCDGTVDEGLDSTTVYRDVDGDGYGNVTLPLIICSDPPAGYVTLGTDCNDGRSTVFPGAPEVCDGIADNNCDGVSDPSEGDVDSDGVANCADSEACDGVDNDGDGLVDEGFDADDDGLADCFDDEDCDGIDNDGDGLADELPATAQLVTLTTTGITAVNLTDASSTLVSNISPADYLLIKAASVAVRADGVAFAVDNNTGNFLRFDPCTGVMTLVGNSGHTAVCGMEFDADGNLYAVDNSSDVAYQVNPATGVFTAIGSLGVNIQRCGLAYDCTLDRMFLVDGDDADTLYRVNMDSGALSNAVTLDGAHFAGAGLEYRTGYGELYASTGDRLLRINPTTGAYVNVGYWSGEVTAVDDMAFIICE